MTACLLIVAGIATAIFLLVKGVMYIEEDDVPPWRKFRIVCPVCRKTRVCWKRNVDRRVRDGFGVHNMLAPTCERCDADMAEPYMRHPYVAAAVAESLRSERFKTEATAYNAAVKTARAAERN